MQSSKDPEWEITAKYYRETRYFMYVFIYSEKQQDEYAFGMFLCRHLQGTI